jgi:hypothetical protein
MALRSASREFVAVTAAVLIDLHAMAHLPLATGPWWKGSWIMSPVVLGAGKVSR